MKPTITKDQYDAVLFDLDGVLTATAKVHAASWKELFDTYLQQRAEARGEEFRPFEIATDYVEYVDGKPRFDGVRDFLRSRGIELPEGERSDPPDRETVSGLGNRKDRMVKAILESQGVEVYEGSVTLARRLRDQGMKLAVVSASKNCAAVLDAAGIADLFEVRVDGVVAERLGLPGKPAPDPFLEAARELGVEPARSVVVEDAISGVQSGRAGNFGLVIGIDRKGDGATLLENGADIVVADLEEMLS